MNTMPFASQSQSGGPDDRIRVIHYLQSSNTGGTETGALYLCQAMADETAGVIFKKDGTIIPRFVRAGIPTLVLEENGSEAELRRFTGNATLINFHIFTGEPEIAQVVALTKLVPVTTLQWFTRLPPQEHPIVCASGAVRGIQDRRNTSVMIHNGVDATEFRPGPARPTPTKIVARIGRDTKMSHHFRTVAEHIQKQSDAAIWVVGSEGTGTDRMRYLGVRDDIPDLMRQFDVLVHTPRPREGAHDLVVLEAMASGVPVVAFDVECVRECIPNSEAGCLVPYGDVNAMASRVVELVHDEGKRRRVARAARQIVEERFQSKMMAGKYRKIYRWALNGHGAVPDLDL